MRTALIAATATLLISTAAAADEFPCRFMVMTIVGFSVDSTTYHGDSRVECFDEYTNPYQGQFKAKAWIVNETTGVTVAEASCPACYQKVWVGATGGVSTVGQCYRSRVSGTSSFYSNEVGSALRCARSESGAPDVCESRPWRCDPRYFEECPLIVQTGDGPWELTSVTDGVTFDLNADGVAERTGWTAAESSLAFLALDLDRNERIDDARELFGGHTRLPDGTNASNGFEALLQYDNNADGVIDAGDPIWQLMLLWNDANHDGMSQPWELQPIAASDILTLETSYDSLNRTDPSGNMFRFKSKLRRASGAARPYYDVYFKTHE